MDRGVEILEPWARGDADGFLMAGYVRELRRLSKSMCIPIGLLRGLTASHDENALWCLGRHQ